MMMYLYILFVVIIVVSMAMICNYFTPNPVKKELFTKNNDSRKTFMIKDLRTNFWLNTDENGVARFISSGFGFNFRMSDNPEKFLPLRSANNPNDYLISMTDGKDNFRIVTNPGSNILKIQVMNLEGKNVLGYTNDTNKDVFININQAGYINTVENPNDASFVNMIFT
jgi:phosphoglycerol transferase MdoB-like AlkP superfamily enzyme